MSTLNDRPCPIASAVADRVIERSQAGYAKYGVTCARTDLTTLQWLQHLQEELLDAAVYIERLKGELNALAEERERLRSALDKARVIAEALLTVTHTRSGCGCTSCETIRASLAIARELGLLEEKP